MMLTSLMKSYVISGSRAGLNGFMKIRQRDGILGSNFQKVGILNRCRFVFKQYQTH